MTGPSAQSRALHVPFLRALMMALAALIASSALLLGAAPASQAAPVVPVTNTSAVTAMVMPVSVQSAQSSVCAVGGIGDSGADKSLLLPVNRWSESTTKMHSLMESQEHVNNAMNAITREGIVGNGLGAGNSMWAMTSGLVTLSADMCPLNSFGGAMDGIVGMLGDAIVKSPIISIIVVVLLISVVWGFARRGGVRNASGLVSKLAAVALLAVMIMGAQASTGAMAFNSSKDTAPYKPGVMSPGWIVTTMNNTVGALASVPAQDLVITDSFTRNSKHWNENMSCSNYMKTMKDGYKLAYHSDLNKMSAGLPMTISTLWETTALQAWRTAQFGPTTDAEDTAKLNLPLDDSAWCRMLDWNADVPLMKADTYKGMGYDPAVQSLNERTMGAKLPDDVMKSKAFSPVSDRDYDRSAIAWAACDLVKGSNGMAGEDSFTVDWRFESHKELESYNATDAMKKEYGNNATPKSVFVGVTGEAGGADGAGSPSEEDCFKWWTKEGEDNDAFQWPTTNKEVYEKAPGNDQLQTFLNTLHGTDNTASVPAMIAYVVASFVILLSFGLLAIGLVIAKFAMALIIVGIFIAVIMVLFPGGSWSKVAGVLKVLLGVMIYTWCIQFLMSVVAFMSKILSNLGSGMFEPGSTFHIFWVGLSPAMAVFLLHLLFTKGLKMASPFSVNGALAWGQKIGGASAAALSGLSSMAGAGRMLKDRANGLTAGRGGKGMDEGPNGNPIQGKNNGVIGGGVGTPTSRRGQVDPNAYGAGGETGPGDGVQTGEGDMTPQGSSAGKEPALVGAVAGAEGGRRGATQKNEALAHVVHGATAPIGEKGEGGALEDDLVETVTAEDGEATPQVGGDDESTETQSYGTGEGAEAQPGLSDAEKLPRGAFDPDMLVTSRVANSKLGRGGLSQVGDGRMSRQERAALHATAEAERSFASEWDNNRRRAMGLKERSSSKLGRFWEHRAANVQAGLYNARRNFAANPVGSIVGGAKAAGRHAGKGALIGAGVLTAGAFAPAMMPLALAGLGGMQLHKMMRKDKKVDRAQMDALVTDYRDQRRQEIKPSQRKGKVNVKPETNPTTGPDQNGGGAEGGIGGGNGGTPIAPKNPQGPVTPTGGQAVPVADGQRNAIAEGYRYATGAGPTVNQDILAASIVPNSQLGKGKASQFGNGNVTFWEKRKVNMAAGQERQLALAFENQRRAARGQAPIQAPTNREALRASANRAGQKITQAGQAIAKRDANAIFNQAAQASGSLAKGYVAGSAAVAAASLMGPVGLPVAAAALGGAALVKSRRKFSAERAGEMDQIVDRYRAHHRAVASGQGAGPVSGHQAEGIQAVPTAGYGESSINAAGPVTGPNTEELPVVAPSAPAPGQQGVAPAHGRRSAAAPTAPHVPHVEQAEAGAGSNDPNRLVVVGDYTGLSYEAAMNKARADGLLPDTKGR